MREDLCPADRPELLKDHSLVRLIELSATPVAALEPTSSFRRLLGIGSRVPEAKV